MRRARRLAAAVTMGVTTIGTLAGSAAAASPSHAGVAPRGEGAGYYGASAPIELLHATIVVPKVACQSAYGRVEMFVAISNKQQSAVGAVEIDCLGKNKSEDILYVSAGNGAAAHIPAENVRPGNRVRVTVSYNSRRLTATATIAGRRTIHMRAKGRPVTDFLVGAALHLPSRITVRPIDIRDATLNAHSLNTAATLVRTSQRQGEKLILTAGPLRQSGTFTIRQH